MDEPQSETYYKIHVKGVKGEYDIEYAVWIDGEWYRRRFYGPEKHEAGFVDRNEDIAYDYIPVGDGMEVISYEVMENQEETKDYYYE